MPPGPNNLAVETVYETDASATVWRFNPRGFEPFNFNRYWLFGRGIVSCVGVIEAVTLAVSGGDKTCR